MGDRIKVWLVQDFGSGGSGGAAQTDLAGEKSAEPMAGGADSAATTGAQKTSDGAGEAHDPGTVAPRAKPARKSAADRVAAAQTAGLARAVSLSAAEKSQAAKAQAAGLQAAAERGAPFCEECERARRALAEAWKEGVT
jgi:hypothetical protein